MENPNPRWKVAIYNVVIWPCIWWEEFWVFVLALDVKTSTELLREIEAREKAVSVRAEPQAQIELPDQSEAL